LSFVVSFWELLSKRQYQSYDGYDCSQDSTSYLVRPENGVWASKAKRIGEQRQN